MQHFLRILSLLLLLVAGWAPAALAQTGGVGVGTTAPHPSALLDLTSTSRGLLAPRLTAAQRAAISNPANGLLVYQTDGAQSGFWYYAATGGWTFVNPTPAGDNLGNHTATQGLNMVGHPISFGMALTQQLNLWTTDYGIGIQPFTLAFRTGGGYAWYKGGAYSSTQHDPGPGGTLHMSLSDQGYLGLGLATAQNRFDLEHGPRTGTHATTRPFYVTGYVDAAANGPEFRHANGTQGIGFGFNSLYAAGTNPDQPLNLMPKGSAGVGIGTISPSQKLEVAGQIYSSTGGFRFPDNTVQTTAATTPAPQTLTLTGQTLGISGGNTVTLPSGADNLGNHTATQNLNLADKLLVGNGGSAGLAISSAGSVGIGATPPASSAQLDVASTTKGFLPPRLTEGQRDAIAGPAAGLVVYNTTTNKLNVWNGTAWTESLNTTEPARTFQFGYTGSAQTWTVPPGVTSVRVDMSGAQGGNSSFTFTNGSTQQVPGGTGARVLANLSVTPGQVLTVYVGGSDGYNGGGAGINTGKYGGGASDLRLGGTALTNRVLVAAGGGGSSASFPGATGGDAGFVGNTAANPSALATPGGGATQTAGGAPGNNGATAGQLGQGGNGAVNNMVGGGYGAGGGGGYYGGGGGGARSGGLGGGGGSSYASPALTSGVSYTTGYRAGNGVVTISVLPSPTISLNNAQVDADNGAVLFNDQGKIAGDGLFLWNKVSKQLALGTGTRLGLGTTTPAERLDVVGNAAVSGNTTIGGALNLSGNLTTSGTASFGSITRQMLNLWGTSYGVGVQDNTQYFRSGDAFAWYTGGSHSNTQFDGGGGGTTQMVLKNSFLGIGAGYSSASGPTGPLEIRRDNASPYIVMHDPGNSLFSFGMDVNDGHKIKIGDGNGLGNTNYMTFSGTNVGIGTTNPAFPLDVQRTVTPGNYAYAFFAAAPNGTANTGSSGSSTGPVSIRATGRILATEFNATSDRRLKTIVGLSDCAADLALLNRLRITDYTMRDKAQYGTRAFKKVIAQEVETIFPQAVNQHSGFLPDVYAVATSVESVGDSLLRLTLPAAVAGAKAGQRIKLIGPASEVVGTVKAATGTTLTVRGATKLAGQQVFVFGLEHADVRTVDYEALAMLNVSATQELARQVKELQAQNAALRHDGQTLKAEATTQYTALAQRLAALESLLGAKAEIK